ncbi:MAG: ABC transporter ATP-binding protein [Candidatus Methanomethylophilus sp.]|nr:ABC transporter ATP-binding protein [Methanomethylophilus sp.]
MSDALVLDGVRKTYGEREAVKGISFSVREGEIFGLIGPNGAGKTTTLRMICTLLEPTSGTIRICGHDNHAEAAEVRKIISYLPEDAGAYKDLTGRQYLRFMAGFFSDGEEFETAVDNAIKLSKLGERIDSKVSTYSKGMTRRLLIARAVMASPRLAVMDEITSGLDVMSAYEIREFVRDLAKNGVTILISSHNMYEVESICDRVAMINHGEMVLSGTPAELRERFGAANLEEVFIKAVKEESE